MWEDKTNKDGGRQLLNLDKKERNKDVLDGVWMETLFCLFGEAFVDSSDDVCGAVAQNRARGDKVSIWTRNACCYSHSVLLECINHCLMLTLTLIPLVFGGGILHARR